MALPYLFVEPALLGSGTGPQTPMPHGAASCGHDRFAHTQGQPLSRAIFSARCLS